MKRFLLVFMLFALFALPISAQEELPSLGDLEAGAWTVMEPGGETICSNGTPYSFFVRPAAEETDKLLIYLQGGGACWFGEICDLNASPQYDPFVDESDVPGPTGIFDYENEANPFADYHAVFLPYCTADVHVGDAVQTYTSSQGDVTINHKGYVNAMSALDWTFANFEMPETVFVTGSSAGSIPAPFYAEFVAEAYPDARIEVLGDAAGGYRNPDASVVTFGNWGTMDILTELYSDYTLEEMDFEAFYVEVGKAYPDITMAQFNNAYDAVQIGFLMLLGMQDIDLLVLLEENFADVEAELPELATFTAGGDAHTVLMTPGFYTYAVGDNTVRDWVASLAAGEEVEDVTCTDCTVLEGASE